MSARFSLGRIVATPGALHAFAKTSESYLTYLDRHRNGDWGDVDAGDARANERAVKEGERILSAYTLGDGRKIWIITEYDRSSTCILLPSEY